MSVSTELLGEISSSKRKQQRSVEGNCLSYEPLFLNFSPALAQALAQIPRTADSRSSSEINLLILLAISFLISLVCPPLLCSDWALGNKVRGGFLTAGLPLASVLSVPLSAGCPRC